MTRGVRVRGLWALALATAISAGLVAGPARSGAVVPDRSAAAASLPAGFSDTVAFSGLSVPTAVAFAPDGRVFVAEKRGVIKVFSGVGDTSATLFADLQTDVNSLSDRGLLGLAVDPQLGTAGHNFVYALYTFDALPGGSAPQWNDGCPTPPGSNTDGCVVTGNLVRIAVRADGTAGRVKALIKGAWCQQFPSHSIGHLGFGPDGMLYVSGGDGASFEHADWGQYGGSLSGTPTPVNPCGDPPGGFGVANTSPTGRGGGLRAQSPRRPTGEPVLLNGALLRVDPATGGGVRGNPMFDPLAKLSNASRIVAYGFRNPFRFAFRPGTNEIWIADVGWDLYEEIDRVKSPKVKPTQNFGWPCYEGSLPNNNLQYQGLDVCKDLYADGVAPAIAPYDTYSHSSKLGAGDTCTNGGGSSVISGISFAATNSNYPSAYDGALFFGDHSRNCIWVMFAGGNGLPKRSTVQTFVDDSDNPFPVDIETDPVTGDVFYVKLDAGQIHQISYTP